MAGESSAGGDLPRLLFRIWSAKRRRKLSSANGFRSEIEERRRRGGVRRRPPSTTAGPQTIGCEDFYVGSELAERTTRCVGRCGRPCFSSDQPVARHHADLRHKGEPLHSPNIGRHGTFHGSPVARIVPDRVREKRTRIASSTCTFPKAISSWDACPRREPIASRTKNLNMR